MQGNSMNLPSALTYKNALKQTQKAIIETFQQNAKAEQLLQDLCRSVDQVLSDIWKQFDFPKDAALIAVGGYGRGELFPHSDVDLLILLSATPERALKEKLEKLVQIFWDIGLDIGHSIRTIDECMEAANADVTVKTSLLEARRIIGSRKLFQQLQQAFEAQLNPQQFFQSKLLEMQQRHVKYEDTPYSLEPNCKESPGGLRDLQVILWVPVRIKYDAGISSCEIDPQASRSGAQKKDKAV